MPFNPPTVSDMVDALVRDIIDSKRVEDVVARIPMNGETLMERQEILDSYFKKAFYHLYCHFTSDVLNYQ